MSVTQVERDQIFLLYSLTESARAIRYLDEIVRLAGVQVQRAPGVVVLENQSIFDALRAALHFSGNVSKVFWPSGNASQTTVARCERLRGLANIPLDHGLSNRALRNHVEHMDERIDTWTVHSPRAFTAVEMAASGPLLTPALVDSVCVIYDRGDQEVRLFGETFRISDLRANVQSVQELVSAAIVC